MKFKPIRYRTEPDDAPLWASEPFRVFFPLGIAASIFGVLIWPLFYAGWWPYSPIAQHPRMMIFGFGAAFVAGFLGTAWPRFLESKSLHPIEVSILVFFWLGAQGCYAVNQLLIGDLIYSIHAALLLGILSLRFRGRGDFPPPGFLLAFASVFLAAGVAFLWFINPGSLPPAIYAFTKLIVWQGLLLFPLLGVGSYLFPRFFAAPYAAKTNSAKRGLAVWTAALLIIISFGLEAVGWSRVGNILRFAALLFWLALAAPAIWKERSPSTRAWALKIAIGSIALSFLCRGFWTGPGLAIVHLLFLGGFGLALVLVADRVSIAHGGGDWKTFPRKSKTWQWIVWLGLLAAATRMSANMKASITVSHHVYAALLWTVVLVIWTVMICKYWVGLKQ